MGNLFANVPGQGWVSIFDGLPPDAPRRQSHGRRGQNRDELLALEQELTEVRATLANYAERIRILEERGR